MPFLNTLPSSRSSMKDCMNELEIFVAISGQVLWCTRQLARLSATGADNSDLVICQ